MVDGRMGAAAGNPGASKREAPPSELRQVGW